MMPAQRPRARAVAPAPFSTPARGRAPREGHHAPPPLAAAVADEDAPSARRGVAVDAPRAAGAKDADEADERVDRARAVRDDDDGGDDDDEALG